MQFGLALNSEILLPQIPKCWHFQVHHHAQPWFHISKNIIWHGWLSGTDCVWQV